MSLDLVTIGKRLREARENCAITQEQAAEAIGVPRTAIVHMEAGRRVPTTLELADLAELYKKPLPHFLSKTFAQDESSTEAVHLHLRVEHAFRQDPEVKASIDKWLQVVREGAELNQLLGASTPEALPLYSQSHPRTLAEAFQQGESVAEQERKRLGLGENPVHMLPDLLSSVGAWVAGVNLPKEISGMFLHERAIGTVILINNSHPRVRRRFSYAHEYAHALIDRERDSTAMVSTQANSTERTEKRANAFAAAFLMPQTGVRNYLSAIDKGGPTRQVHAVYGIAGSEQAEERTAPGSQKIVYQDVARLARYFGVSYQVAVYRLRDLNVIGALELQALVDQMDQANSYLKVLRFAESIDTDEVTADGVEETGELVSQVVYRAIEAYRRQEISRGRLLDLGAKIGIPGKKLVELAEAAI
jgi:Zn-dependent peptidase ImmA (M78 family)/transcriptional regulator with XRE-family HTH domain